MPKFIPKQNIRAKTLRTSFFHICENITVSELAENDKNSNSRSKELKLSLYKTTLKTSPKICFSFKKYFEIHIFI